MSTKEKTRLLMEACKGKERDDQSAKSFFHRKDFLANVLKGTVSEYADLTIREIMDCIEGDTIQTGTALVSEDAADTIRGENTQLTTIGEAPVTYDILFRSLIPQFKETIKVNLHIDLEIQQEYSVSYPLERRAIYYAARKISAQLPKVGKMESDISIWKKFTAFGYAWMTFLGISKTQSLITKCLIIKQKESDRVRIVSVFLKKHKKLLICWKLL